MEIVASLCEAQTAKIQKVIIGGVFWAKLELSLNKIRLRILNNPAKRFRPPPLRFGELGIDESFVKVLPEQKSEKVKLLQSKGQKAAMVGDGINDAPALTQADLGIAIGAGTNVAIESAGIILVRNDPRDIAKIIRLSRLMYRKMIQNLFWASGYNIVAIPLAAGVLASQGILLSPALGAVFMSLSTVIVAFNAMLLRWRNL